jgi:hypothetical protein
MIQRYELELYDTEAGCDFHKSDNGDLCKYEDAQKLEQENERLTKELNALKKLERERWEGAAKAFGLKETGNEP